MDINLRKSLFGSEKFRYGRLLKKRRLENFKNDFRLSEIADSKAENSTTELCLESDSLYLKVEIEETNGIEYVIQILHWEDIKEKVKWLDDYRE